MVLESVFVVAVPATTVGDRSRVTGSGRKTHYQLDKLDIQTESQLSYPHVICSDFSKIYFSM
jgi:hypothetical protein